MTAIPVVEFDENGDIVTLYTDEIDLYELGVIGEVRRASHVEFDQANQKWVVLRSSGEVVHRARNRERAIEWEITNFGPGGQYYSPGVPNGQVHRDRVRRERRLLHRR